MRNFRKIVLLCLIVCFFEGILGFALEPITFKHYLEKELTRKKEENIDPDLAFFGNSRISTSFIPNVFIEGIENVDLAFNGGTGSQGIEGTYYYLKDVLKRYDLKYAVVGIDYQTILKEERVLKRDLVVLERLRSPIIKAEYIANVFEPSEYIYFLKSFQYRNNVSEVAQNLKRKLSKEYRQGIYKGEGMVYENLGFTRETAVFGNSAGIITSQPWFEENIDWDKMKYLDKIVDLCKTEGVQLYFVSTPLTISTVYATEGYEQCVDYFEEYADKNNIPYDNLNLLKGRDEFLPDSIMNCMEHVGNEGADIVSEYYCKILDDRINGKSVDSYFYSSVTEMKENMKSIVASGIRTEQVDKIGNRKIIGKFLGKKGVDPEYQFEIEIDKDIIILKEFGDSDECQLPIDKIMYPMVIRMRCRDKNDMTYEQITEVYIDENTWKVN